MAKEKAEGAVTDQELANLSDEEREALEDEGTDTKALEQIAGEGEEEEEEPKDKKGAGEKKEKPGKAEDADEEEEEDDEAAAAGKGDDKADDKADVKAGEKAGAKDAEEKAAEAEGEDDEDDEPEFVLPRYSAPAVDKYDEKIAALETRDAEAVAKFKAGDLELDQLLAEQSRVAKERRALDEAKVKHDISAEMSSQTDKQAWLNEVDRFMFQVRKTDGVDYKKNRTLNAAFDQAVKDLAGAQDKAGNYINNDRSPRWFLREAHKQVLKDIGRGKAADDDAGEKGDNKGDDKKAKAKAAADARKTDPKKLPKTLSKVPAADDEDVRGEGEFSELDGLEGLDLEDAVARMTPAQQEKWARSTAS